MFTHHSRMGWWKGDTQPYSMAVKCFSISTHLTKISLLKGHYHGYIWDSELGKGDTRSGILQTTNLLFQETIFSKMIYPFKLQHPLTTEPILPQNETMPTEGIYWRSSRTLKEPSWWKNYIMATTKVSSEVSHFLLNATQEKEPKNYKHAKTDPRWVEAMERELNALDDNNTWELVPYP